MTTNEETTKSEGHAQTSAAPNGNNVPTTPSIAQGGVDCQLLYARDPDRMFIWTLARVLAGKTLLPGELEQARLVNSVPFGDNGNVDRARAEEFANSDQAILKAVSQIDLETPPRATTDGGHSSKVRDIEIPSTTVWDQKEAPLTADYIKALEGLGYTFRMNMCNDGLEINQAPMSDAQRCKIRSQMRDHRYSRVNVCEDAYTGHALDNQYHPVREYLDALEWDGKDHIAALAEYVQDDLNYFHMFFRRWAVGAVARAYEKTQNRMLVLDGSQGLGKSHLVRWLVSGVEKTELFIEQGINPDDKDCLVRLISTWIWEVSELGSTTRRSDREALKYFLSMEQATVRRAFGRFDLIKPALSSFIGTVNNVSGILKDPSGYRRFMAVNLTFIDWDYCTAINPCQVWAQAKTLYDAGERWHLDTDEAELAADSNKRYEIKDPLLDVVMKYFKVTGDRTDFCSSALILDTLHAQGWRMGAPTYEATLVSEAMHELKERGVVKGRGKDSPEEDRANGYRGLKSR